MVQRILPQINNLKSKLFNINLSTLSTNNHHQHTKFRNFKIKYFINKDCGKCGKLNIMFDVFFYVYFKKVFV